jgi:hypothetical protein
MFWPILGSTSLFNGEKLQKNNKQSLLENAKNHPNMSVLS